MVEPRTRSPSARGHDRPSCEPASGGLHQIIQDYDPSTGSGNGFLFFDYSPEALWDTIGRAKKFFANTSTPDVSRSSRCTT